jgi:GTP-binding protein
MKRFYFTMKKTSSELLSENHKKILKISSSKKEESIELFSREATFMKSVQEINQLPPISSLCEASFFGRSKYFLKKLNFSVGKSTLLNSLLVGKNLVKTSKTPGQTKYLNYFTIQNKLLLVDMPGYGYAQ